MMFRPRSFARFARSLRSVELIEPACGRHPQQPIDRRSRIDRRRGLRRSLCPPNPPPSGSRSVLSSLLAIGWEPEIRGRADGHPRHRDAVRQRVSHPRDEPRCPPRHPHRACRPVRLDHVDGLDLDDLRHRVERPEPSWSPFRAAPSFRMTVRSSRPACWRRRSTCRQALLPKNRRKPCATSSSPKAGRLSRGGPVLRAGGSVGRRLPRGERRILRRAVHARRCVRGGGGGC